MMHMNNNYNVKRRTPSKVISIPVHFVGSERNRTESATKIQKVTKGFLVRKSMKKMISMKMELGEMENTVNAPEMGELMKKKQKEKVRVAETIMNLLLKLDSVRVFHCSALREFRKSLIKRAIAIQEFVDQIQLVNEVDHQPQSTEVSVAENEMNDCGKENDCLANEVEEEHEEEQEEGEKMGMDDEREESVGTNLVEEEEEKEDCVVKVKQEEEEEEEEEDCKGGDDGNKEMLKRMMEENEKMMNMMTQLFERNEMQTALLTSLTQRVEQLEKAFTFDRLRRKKRRNLDAKHKLCNL